MADYGNAPVGTAPAAGGGAGMDPRMMMFMQYLSGAGAAMSQNKPIAPALNQMTQQNMANQSMLKLMQKMLNGDNELAGKFDSKGMQLSVPSSMLSGESGGTQFESGTGTAPAPGELAKSPYVNPSSSPLDALTAADLVGLTPENLNQALQFKMMKDELAGKQTYQQQQLGVSRMNAQTAKRNADVSLLNAIRTMGKDERTAAIQNFEYAANNGFTGTFAEFQRENKTTHEKDYKASVEGGYKGTFHEWLREMTSLSGGLNLGEKKDVEEMKDAVAAKSYFSDPKGLVTDVDRYVNTEDVQNSLFQFADDPRKMEMEKIRKKESFINSKIKSAGGQILKQVLDGRDFVWSVKWPDGKITEVRYAN